MEDPCHPSHFVRNEIIKNICQSSTKNYIMVYIMVRETILPIESFINSLASVSLCPTICSEGGTSSD